MGNSLCRKCATEEGLIQSINTSTSFTGSGNVGDYQYEKFVKHTQFPAGSGPISIFRDKDYDSYKDFIIDTAVSGSLEMDDKGRRNLIFIAKKIIGDTYIDGVHEAENDSVKLVLLQKGNKIHAYPTSSQNLRTIKCHKCQKLIYGK